MRTPRVYWLLLPFCPCVLLLSGCGEGGAGNPSGTSGKGDDALPSLDARGGESNSEEPQGSHTPLEGAGGNGGSIHCMSTGGSISITRATPATGPQAPVLTGNGFVLASDRHRRLSGVFVVDFLQIQRGATLILTGDTQFLVLGDVVIDGTIRSARGSGDVDANDLSIEAGGIVNITGAIDMSGFDGEDEFEADEERGAGGNGGALFITSGGANVFISGGVVSDGGDTFATNPGKSRPGSGGQIVINSAGIMTIPGRVSARGGFSRNQGVLADATALGGDIQLIAAGNLEIGRVLEVNASGGATSGLTAGNGGSILFEAPGGTVSLTDMDVECRGGRAFFSSGSTAGTGGSVNFLASNLTLDNTTINASGGNALGADRDGSDTGGLTGGVGGAGGTIELNATGGMTVDTDVFLEAEGGASNLTASDGGTGGAVRVIGGAVTFDGSITVDGGLNELGATGLDGTVCEVPVGALSGVFFPVEACTIP